MCVSLYVPANRRRLEEAEGGWTAAEARAMEAEATLGGTRRGLVNP